MFDIESGSLTPSGLAFTRNPIRLQRNNSDLGGVKAYPFTVSMGGEVFFKGRFDYPLEMELSGIVDGYASNFRDAEFTGEPIIEICDEGTLRENEIRVICNGADDFESGFIAIPGGISRQNLKKIPPGSDIFRERFLNPKANFFLTTRSAHWRLVIKETELYPLYFIADSDIILKIVDPLSKAQIELDTGAPGVYALDLEALRLKFWTGFFVLVNVFDVYCGGNHSCRIVIEQAQPSPQRYWLKFRNSLGVFELIELTGQINISVNPNESDDAVCQSYDPIADLYSFARPKVELSRSMTAHTGAKSHAEILHLVDALGSDEVYLLGLTVDPLRVIPFAEEMTHSPDQREPQQIELTLKVADNEINISEEITSPEDACKPRIFSDHFNDKFN